MSIVVASGSQLCTVGAAPANEKVLINSADAMSLVACFDFSPAQAGDIFHIRMKRKMLVGSTLREVVGPNDGAIVLGDDIAAGISPNWQSVPMATPGHQAVVTLTQTAGSARTIDYSMESV